MDFDLIVRTSSGEVLTRRIAAASRSQALAQATAAGQRVMRCAEAGVRAGEAAPRRAGASPWRRELGALAHELGALLEAGLGVIEALRILEQKQVHAGRRQSLQEVASLLAQGRAFSDALADVGHFPPMLIAAVAASEQTGELDRALGRYAEQQQRFRALRDKLVGASVYPALLLALGSLVVLFLLGGVVPKFASLVESTGHELPAASRVLMAWGAFVAAHPLQVGLGLAMFAAAAIAAALEARRRGAWSRLAERLPWVGAIVRRYRHAQLYRSAGMLVRGGVPLPKAFGLAQNLLGDADRERLRAAVALLTEGRDLRSALHETGLADPTALSLLAVGQRTGRLADILDRIAQLHDSELQHTVDVATRLVEPVLMIAIGLVIGSIVVLMYLPIFDLASSLQ